MRRITGTIVCFALAAAASGCAGASARYVNKGPEEGVIAIPCDTEENRQKAHDLMAAHFPDGYEITWEEEAKTGAVSYRTDRTRVHEHGPFPIRFWSPSSNNPGTTH